jgi:hypothetical protein
MTGDDVGLPSASQAQTDPLSATAAPFRFAVLLHDHPFPHADLLLETGNTCWTWRILDRLTQTSPWVAERIANHRTFYLNYSGPVSGDRGSVTPWDQGRLVWLTACEQQVTVLVTGRVWTGRLELMLQQPGNRWLVQLSPREPHVAPQ